MRDVMDFFTGRVNRRFSASISQSAASLRGTLQLLELEVSEAVRNASEEAAKSSRKSRVDGEKDGSVSR